MSDEQELQAGDLTEKTIFCPHCDTQVLAGRDRRYCTHCGFRLWVSMDNPWEPLSA